MLQDTSTYLRIDKDSLTRITNKLRNLLVRWKIRIYFRLLTKNYIDNDGILPKAYAFSKVLIAYIALSFFLLTVRYNLATFLHEVIIKSVSKAPSFINNSFKSKNSNILK